MPDVRSELCSRIRSTVAPFIQLSPEAIDDSRDFAEYGLGSAEAAMFIGALEDTLGHELPPLLVYDNPTVAALADAIAALQAPVAE